MPWFVVLSYKGERFAVNMDTVELIQPTERGGAILIFSGDGLDDEMRPGLEVDESMAEILVLLRRP